MAQIYNLRIKNFRCFKDFTASFGREHFIVLIGRGDSGKSSILKAIDALLSPQWNYSFNDWDFFNCDVSNPIIIEGDLINLPEDFFTLDTIRFNYKILKNNGTITSNIIDINDDEDIPLVTLRLIVDDTLEPKWYIVSDRDGVPDVELHSKDRELLKSFIIADTNDLQFTYHRQSPLVALANNSSEDRNSVNHKMISVVREAYKQGKKISDFSEFNDSAQQVMLSAAKLGIDAKIFDAQLDYKDNAYTLRNVGLHKDNKPCRLLGNGSKRLISMSIQLELTRHGGIVLVDEIEQGLEPDRLLSIIQLFKNNNCGQMILTTHSSYVVQECSYNQLRRVIPDHSGIWDFSDCFASILRTKPEVFFAKRIILCEGKTEQGLLRAIDDKLRDSGEGFSRKGIVIAECKGGTTFYDYAAILCQQKIDVCVICDNDVKEIEKHYLSAKNAGATIIRWDDNNCFEQQVFKDIPSHLVIQLIDLARRLNPNRNIESDTNLSSEIISNLTKDNTNIDKYRSQFGNAAKKFGWFKDIDKAQFLSNLILDELELGCSLENTVLCHRLKCLHEWIKK